MSSTFVKYTETNDGRRVSVVHRGRVVWSRVEPSRGDIARAERFARLGWGNVSVSSGIALGGALFGALGVACGFWLVGGALYVTSAAMAHRVGLI